MTTPATTAGFDAPPAHRYAIPPFVGPVSTAGTATATGGSRWMAGPYVPAAQRAQWSLQADAAPAAAVSAVDPLPAPTIAAVVTPAAPELASAESVPALFGEATDEGGLPWIDQFLATTPVAPLEAIAGPPDVYRFVTPRTTPVTPLPLVEASPSAAASAVVDRGAATPAPAALETAPAEETAPAGETEPAAERAAQPTPWYATPLYSTPLVNEAVATPGPLSATLSETPSAMPEATVSEAAAGAVPPYVPPSVPLSAPRSATPVHAHTPALPTAAALLGGSAGSDDWPLAEAAGALEQLTRELTDDVPIEDRASLDSVDVSFGQVATPMALPAWTDDDLLNIMPTREATPSAPASVDELFAEEPSASAAGPDTSATAAAEALELLAQRVRNGELQLPGYDPRMGDAAALVSALAALLGIKLG